MQWTADSWVFLGCMVISSLPFILGFLVIGSPNIRRKVQQWDSDAKSKQETSQKSASSNDRPEATNAPSVTDDTPYSR